MVKLSIKCIFECILIFSLSNYSNSKTIPKKFDLLLDFTSAVIKDVIEKSPEIRTVWMIECENNLRPDFFHDVIKRMPESVAKLSLKPFSNSNDRRLLVLGKSMVILIADNVKEVT